MREIHQLHRTSGQNLPKNSFNSRTKPGKLQPSLREHRKSLQPKQTSSRRQRSHPVHRIEKRQHHSADKVAFCSN